MAAAPLMVMFGAVRLMEAVAVKLIFGVPVMVMPAGVKLMIFNPKII